MLKTNAAHWCNHPNAVQAAPLLRTWLTDPGSMTVKLKARCQQFRVQRLRQQSGNALRDESHLLGLTPRQRVVERDVILYCDGQPVVFGHTVLAQEATPSWPFFRALGERPLGGSLFVDPLVTRGALQFARLHAAHPLVRRISSALAGALPETHQGAAHAPSSLSAHLPLYARRSLFRRHGSLMLVTDVFLPALSELMALNIEASNQ